MDKLNVIKEVINDGGSATFCSVVAIVSQKMKSKASGNPFFGLNIQKKVKYQFSLNCVYQNVVNNALSREGKETGFESSVSWHQKVFDGVNGSIVEKRSDPSCKYLLGIVNHADTLEYYVDGVLSSSTETQLIKQWSAESSIPTNQGTEIPIVVRTIALENIKSIKSNGVEVTFE